MTRRQLSSKEIASKIADMERATEHGDTPEWRALHGAWEATPALLTIPLGEVANPALAGFWYAARLRGVALNWQMQEWSPLAVQGIEPLTTVPVSLVDALLVAQTAGAHRVGISI